MVRRTVLVAFSLIALTVIYLSFADLSTHWKIWDRGTHQPGTQTPDTGHIPGSQNMTLTTFRTQSRKTTHQQLSGSNLPSNKNLSALNDHLHKIIEKHYLPNDTYFGYNVSVSDKLPLFRNSSDKRNSKCRDINYNFTEQLTVSIIIPFHNEALTPLLRHVHTLLLRTPFDLLKEIILVDDRSTFSYLGADLDRYFELLDKRIRILRNKKREGLIRTRMNGARKSRGDVLVFLDAHMEVGVAWLEPLLERIVSHPRIVVQPDIPDIEYRFPKTRKHLVVSEESDKNKQDASRAGMSWELSQDWFPFPPYLHQVGYQETDALPTPALQGSAIAVRKSYFMSIRGFDEGLNIWGGEQLELALKVWMTGGRVETVPCSIVGHVFKDNPHLNNDKKSALFTKNLLRIAEIWMDEYADFVFASCRAESSNDHLPTFTSREVESIEEGKNFRKQIGSESFQWYLEHVFPELKVPSRDDLLWGEITMNDKCLFVVDDAFIDFDTVCESYGISFRTIFSLDNRGRLRNNNQCFGMDTDNMNIVAIPFCREDMGESDGKWEYTEHDQLMYRSPNGTYCLGYFKSEDVIHMEACESRNDRQSWSFQVRFEWAS